MIVKHHYFTEGCFQPCCYMLQKLQPTLITAYNGDPIICDPKLFWLFSLECMDDKTPLGIPSRLLLKKDKFLVVEPSMAR